MSNIDWMKKSQWREYTFYPQNVTHNDLWANASMWWACPNNLSRFLDLNRIILSDLLEQAINPLHKFMMLGAADVNIRNSFETFATKHTHLWLHVSYLREFWANRNLAGYTWDDIRGSYSDIIARIRDHPAMRRAYSDVYIHALHEYILGRTFPSADDCHEIVTEGYITPSLCYKLLSVPGLDVFYRPTTFSKAPADGLLSFVAAAENTEMAKVHFLNYFPNVSIADGAVLIQHYPSFNVWADLEPLDEFYLCMKWGRPHSNVGALLENISIFNFDMLSAENISSQYNIDRLQIVVPTAAKTILWIAELLRKTSSQKYRSGSLRVFKSKHGFDYRRIFNVSTATTKEVHTAKRGSMYAREAASAVSRIPLETPRGVMHTMHIPPTLPTLPTVPVATKAAPASVLPIESTPVATTATIPVTTSASMGSSFTSALYAQRKIQTEARREIDIKYMNDIIAKLTEISEKQI